jgi:chromosome segregation ATPase
MTDKRTPLITYEQAREAFQALVDEHFHNASGRRTKFSIPAEPDDTDLLLSAYLEQQRAEVSSLESQLKESAGLVEYWNKSYWEMAEKRDQATANEKSWRLSAEAAESRLQERQSELHDVHTDLLEAESRLRAVSEALQRAIRVIDLECDDIDLIAELNKALAPPTEPTERKPNDEPEK